MRISGIPCLANIPSSFGMVDLADVEVTISTSGNRLYASMTTSKYSPVGKGPKKSMLTVCHGAGGNFVIFNGSGRAAGPVAWQAKQCLIIFSVRSSIPGNQGRRAGVFKVFTNTNFFPNNF